jgi:5-hydroxyisourate hydrolase
LSITTHVLDTARGCPADGVPILLEHRDDERWQLVGRGTTDGNGRLKDLVPPSFEVRAGVYRLRFDTRAYFARHHIPSFFPDVVVTFEVAEANGHYHVPLLLSPFGYSTYRGS